MFLLDRLNIVANLLEKIMSHNRNIMFQQDATVLRRAHETVKLLKTVTPDFTPTNSQDLNTVTTEEWLVKITYLS